MAEAALTRAESTHSSQNGACRSYEESLAAERRIYENCVEVHDLPPIFHYWSNRHLREKLLPSGIGSVAELFKKFLERQCRRPLREPKRFISLGSGNCDLELEVALHLRARQCGDFVIECLDVNPAMLTRGNQAAAAAGLSQYLLFTTGDLNGWRPARDYHAVIANQSLHHVLNLEGLFASAKRSLLPGGSFVISDMIGRNGHQRWPEAIAIVQEFWSRLPPSYRFNRKFANYNELFQDWDCSVEGFEGVRSEDILPLLLRHFHFELFLPFGNIIDPFVDRSFGFNFDAEAEWDRNFIDEVHARDEAEIAAGRIKPTHMLAVVSNEQHSKPVLFGHLTPEFCVRPPHDSFRNATVPAVGDPYQWQVWPGDARCELANVARRFATLLSESASEVVRLENELLDRTEWALSLDREVDKWQRLLVQLNAEMEDRTRWALRMDREFGPRTDWALRLNSQLLELESELDERTNWAMRLQSELEVRTSWALQLRSEYEAAIQHALGLATELEKTRGLSGALLILRRGFNAIPGKIARLIKAVGGRTLRIAARARPGAA